MVAKGELVEDMIEEILLRLPVPSLLRFMSASKQWRRIISSSKFAAAHLRRQQGHSTDSKDHLLLFYKADNSTRRTPEINPGITLISGGGGEDGGVRAVDLDVPPLTIADNWRLGNPIVGCANGLVCISLDREGMQNYLWNPATREYRALPDPSFATGKGTDVILGFGCSDKTIDCKLLRIVKGDIWKVEVFSLGLGCWVQVKDVKELVFGRYSGGSLHSSVTLKGVLYLALGEHSIKSFDFEDEVFGAIEAPPCLVNGLIVYKEALAVLSSKGYPFNTSNGWTWIRQEIEMWIMDDHGSWTKLFTCRTPGSSSPKALGNWQDSETLVIFQNAKRSGVVYTHEPYVLYLYDPLAQKVKKHITTYKQRLFRGRAHHYVPSLVSVYAEHEVNICIPGIVPDQSRFDVDYEPMERFLIRDTSQFQTGLRWKII